MPGDEFLPKQRVAYLAYTKYQTLEYFVGQPIVEFFDKRTYCADCMRTVAYLHFRFRQRRVPIDIEPHGITECLAQLVRYGIRRQRSRRLCQPHSRTFHCDSIRRNLRSRLRNWYRRNADVPAAARSAAYRRA